jgi:uncharacterized membrane protein SpoIIM required for sporulation
MFESLVNIKKAERKPWELFFIGLLYASLSILIVDLLFLRDTVFKDYSSILIITFTVIFCIPFFYYLIKLEEEKDVKMKKDTNLLKEHGKALSALTFLFLGLLCAFVIFYAFLPQEVTAQNFAAQMNAYCDINYPDNVENCVNNAGLVQPESTSISLKGNEIEKIFVIFTNNFFVLVFVLIFSLMFGAGSIFILAWNASVIAAAIGIFMRGNILYLLSGFFRYLIHGIPEIAAYFIAALAGGILSVAIIRHNFNDKEFWKVVKDSINMFLISIVVLVAAALIEVLIVPLLF